MSQLQNSGDSAGLGRIAMQSSELTALLSRVATAAPVELAALQNDVIAVAAAVADSVHQARDGGTASTAAATLNSACAASRATVASVMASMGDFDLDFASAEDERAYREREAARRADIVAQQARHSPEGDLNAAGAAMGQMVDARAHGASGPEFDKRWNELTATTERLRETAKANGVSAEEFDERLGSDIRRILTAKGLSAAQIDAQLAAHQGDPMEAAKAFVQDETDLAKMRRSAERIGEMDLPVKASSQDEVTGLIASLQAAGVVSDTLRLGAVPHHGVMTNASPTTIRSV